MPDPLVQLLDVQGRDLAADQLRHRRASLPERAELAAHEDALAAVDRDAAKLTERLHEIERSQRRLEDDVSSIESKAASESTRMYSGSVSSPRELQALQEEIDALKRRQRDLEDSLLELMEAAEPLTDELETLSERRAQLDAEAERLRATIADAAAVIDAELAQVEAARTELATSVPDALLAEYERLRARLGGVGIARLDGAQCTGCHLTLPATELDAVRHAAPGAVVHHEECGRILVR